MRCSPILYKLVPSTSSKSCSNKDKDKDKNDDEELKEEEAGSTGTDTTSKEPEPDSMIPGRYRIMFAVVTVSAVMVYDTQHEVETVLLLCLNVSCALRFPLLLRSLELIVVTPCFLLTLYSRSFFSFYFSFCLFTITFQFYKFMMTFWTLKLSDSTCTV